MCTDEASATSVSSHPVREEPGTQGQEPRFLPHYQVTKASPRDLDHAKGVAPRGKPFGPESPLQGSHVQQSKVITLDAAAIRPNSL